MKTNEKNVIRLDLAKVDIELIKALSVEPTIRTNQAMLQTLAKELKSRINESKTHAKCTLNILPYLENEELMRSFIGCDADVNVAIGRYSKDCQTLLELLMSCKEDEKVVLCAQLRAILQKR